MHARPRRPTVSPSLGAVSDWGATLRVSSILGFYCVAQGWRKELNRISMSAFSPPRRQLSIGIVPRTVLLSGAAAVLGVASARVAISHYGPTAIELLIAVPVLIFVVPRPFVAAIFLLALLGSIFEYGVLPRANLPGHPPINVADVLLAVVVAGTIWRQPWRTWPPAVRGYTVALVVLVLLASISSVEIALHGADPARAAALGLRNLLYLALALTIALEFSGRLWRPLLNVAVALAAIVSIISIATAASGGIAQLVSHVNPLAVANFSTDTGSTSRVRLPGLFFAYAMCIPTLVLALTVKDRLRGLRIAALFLIVAAIAISLNRNMYFGAVLGLLVTILVGGPRLRHRVLLTGIIALATLVLVVESVKPGVATEIEQRAGSGLSSQVLSTGSAQARALEFHFAFMSIASHPWDGVGWMQDYGLEAGTGSGPRVFVEDLYVHLATDYGIPAAIAFLLVPGFLLFYGLRRVRVAVDPVDRAFLAAAIGAVVALLLSCLVGTYLQSPDSTASFAAACGLLLAAGVRASPRKRDATPSQAGTAQTVA